MSKADLPVWLMDILEAPFKLNLVAGQYHVIPGEMGCGGMLIYNNGRDHWCDFGPTAYVGDLEKAIAELQRLGFKEAA